MNILNILKTYSVKTIDITNNSDIQNTNKMLNINKLVQKIYVINLLEDIHKRNYIYLLMKKYGISFTFVIVDRISKETHKDICEKETSKVSRGELGCCLSHLWCLNDIIKNKYCDAIIFEDDIILHKDFINRLSCILNTNTNQNENQNTNANAESSNSRKYDFLLLGAHDFQFSKKNFHKVNKDQMIYRPYENSEQLYGAHANYYSLRGATRMFRIRISELSFFDKEYMLMFNHFKDTSAICYPNLAVTNMTASSLNHERNALSNAENEYYKKCFIEFDFAQYNFIYINMLNKQLVHKYNTFEKYVETCLYYLFYDFDKMNKIKNRFVMDFFTLKDVMFIFSKKYKDTLKDVSPQTVSLKNESENNHS